MLKLQLPLQLGVTDKLTDSTTTVTLCACALRVNYYHGTTLVCDVATSQTPCSDGNCGICGISSSGLDPQYIRKNIAFQRFGNGFYLAPNSSKCHDYTKGAHGYRAMLLCDVLPGRKHILVNNKQNLTSPPPGYHCVYAGL